MQFSISCDFDGTITLKDTVDAVLERFAEPEWEVVEADWKAGKFGSRECLAEQTKLLRMTPTELDSFLDDIEVDADAKGFFDDCFRMGIPVSVVSDGYDWAVSRVLARAGIRGVQITANRLIHMGDDRWMARFPHSANNCGSGVCKCAVVNQPVSLVHIGDGPFGRMRLEHGRSRFRQGQPSERTRESGSAVHRLRHFFGNPRHAARSRRPRAHAPRGSCPAHRLAAGRGPVLRQAQDEA